jgi:hypothetical protein
VIVPTARFACVLVAGIALGLAVAACAAKRTAPTGSGAVLFDGAIAELAPLHAGDWFLYRASAGTAATQLRRSELTATDRAHELLLTMFDDGGRAVARVRLQLDERTVRVVSETDLASDIGAVYATPLPLYSVPVYEHATARSKVDLVRVSDGQVLDQGEVQMEVVSARDPKNGDIVSRIDRQLVMPGNVLPTTLAMWIRPGVGQVASEGLGGERRELVCARIGGVAFGTCPPG